MRSRLSRRQLLRGSGALAGAAILGTSGSAAAAPAPMKRPPPIGRPERLARLAGARALMKRHGIGAILIEPSASLD